MPGQLHYHAPVKFFLFSKASAATHQVVAGVTGKRLCILHIHLHAAASVTVVLEDGTTDKSGAMTLSTTNAFAPGFNPLGHIITTAGADFAITLGGAQQVSGYGSYQEID